LENCLITQVIDALNQYHLICAEAVNNFRLHPMSILYAYNMFEPLLTLWIGIWMHPCTINHHKCCPRLRKAGSNLRWLTCANDPTSLVLRP
jgi:hypothetical protein